MAQIIPAEPDDDDKPYVGPRTFKPSQWRRFFGRDREARDLQARIISERFTLFYAQSGAGKSSLINTKIVPGLEAEGFEVLPIARVSGHSGSEVTADNIFTYNLLSSLHQMESTPPGLATVTIAHFLDNLVCHDGVFFYDEAYEWPSDAELKPRVLIIDQFEEIITTNTSFWAEREPFFRQLGEALAQDEMLWIVLALREDFIANLDPYLHLVNRGVRQRFYMQHLDRENALLAIKMPVANLRPFDEDAAEVLVNNLLASRRHSEGREEISLAEFVEPVQLQAVCYQMWEKLQTRPGPTITCRDVEEFADVDTALVSFYEDTIADTIAWSAEHPEAAVTETDLRHWFDSQLVTEAGTRNMVFRGAEETGGLPTEAADYLRSRFIVREVVRPGGVFYELVHDRFINPIQEANRKWLQDQPLLQLAQQWKDADNSEARLLTGVQLEDYDATNWEALGPLVGDFMETSKRSAQKRERRIRTYQFAAAGAVILFLIGLAAFLTFTVSELRDSNAEKDASATRAAESARELADQNIILSDKEAELAASLAERDAAFDLLTVANRELQASRLADAASDYLTQGRLDPSILLSYQAIQEDSSPRVRSVLFDSMNNKIEQRGLESPLRGEYPAPFGGYSARNPAGLMTGPVVDSLAAIDGGRIVWWALDDSGRASAEPFLVPVEAGAAITGAAFNAQHTLLATSTGSEFQLWPLADGVAGLSQTVPITGTFTAPAFSADGRRLAAVRKCETGDECAGNRIEVWDIVESADGSVSLSPIKAIPNDVTIIDLAFVDEGGREVVWTDSFGIVISGIDSETRKVLPRLTTEKTIVGELAVSPAGNLLVASVCDDVLTDSDTSDGTSPEPTPIASPQSAGPSVPQPLFCGQEDVHWQELWFLEPDDLFGLRLPGRLVEPTFLPEREQFLFVSGEAGGAAAPLPYWSASLDAWQSNACAVAGRNLTAEEWLDLNPGQSLTEYKPDCDTFPIHPTVVESRLQECRARPTEDDFQTCLLALSGEVDAPINPADLRQVDSWIADARESAATYETSAASRLLAEAGGLLGDLPEPVASLYRNQLDMVYADICGRGGVTPSPLVLEACLRAPKIDLGLGDQRFDSEEGRGLWRFEGEAGDFITASVEALGGGDATLGLYDAQLNELILNDDFNGFNPQITLQLPAAGDYFLKVGWYAEGQTQSYILSTTTTPPLTIGEQVAEPEQRLWYVEGSAGDVLNVSVEALDGGTPWLRITDSLSTELAFSEGTELANPQLSIPLSPGAPYIVEVGWNGPAEGYLISADITESEPVALGDSIEVDDPARQYWVFDGRQGDFVTIAAETSADATLTLYGPDGALLDSRDEVDADPSAPLTEFLEYLLPQDGAYTVFVDQRTEQRQPYTLSLSRQEPETLVLGESLDVEPEQRLWRIDGQAGDTVTIDAVALDGGDAWLRVLDTQATELAFSDNGEGSSDPRITFQLPRNDTYYIELGWFDTPGRSSLTTSVVRPAALELGATRAASADEVWWRLDGQPGEFVDISVDAGGLAALNLYGAQLEYLATSEPVDGRTDPLGHRFTEAGPVFVQVVWQDTPRPYTISVSTEEPQPLLPGAPVPDAGPDERLWVFEGQAGDYIRFAVEALDGSDPWLSLRNSRFEELVLSSDFGGGTDPLIAYLLPDDGPLFIEVGWDGTPGRYALSATEISAAPLPMEESVAAADAGADLWTFEGRAGDLVTIAMDSGESGDAWLQLRDAGFMPLSNGYNDDFGGLLTPRLSLVLPSDGPYAIELGWFGTAVPYTLSVTAEAASEALPIEVFVPAGDGARSVWAFQGRAGDVVSAAIDAGGNGDGSLTLYDQQRNALAYSDDFDDLNPRLTVRLPADGLYTLEAQWRNDTGEFELVVPFSLTATTLDPQPLAIGAPVAEASAEQRLWRFTGQAGQTVTIAAEAAADGENPWLQLFNDRFERLTFSDNADSLNPSLTFELPESGEYYVEVGWFGEPGAYRLMIEE